MGRSEFIDYLLEEGECSRFDEHQVDALEQFCFTLYDNTELDKPSERIAEFDKERAVRDLEQQAKGLTDYAKTQEQGMVAVWIISAASKLLEQAEALKEQGE
jgi:hypothetical protein